MKSDTRTSRTTMNYIKKKTRKRPTTFQNLPMDLVAGTILPFVGPGSHLYVAGVCKFLRQAYTEAYPAKTSMVHPSLQSLECVWLTIRRQPEPAQNLMFMSRHYMESVMEVQRKRETQKRKAFMRSAAANGCRKALMLVDDCWDEDCCASAARYGQLKTLQWLRKRGCKWDSKTCAAAALCGHMKTLKWAHANCCPWDKWVCANLAKRGLTKELMWARRTGCPWDALTLNSAVQGGSIATLQYVREEGCKWGPEAYIFATNRSIVEWLSEHGCPWSSYCCAHFASKGALTRLKVLRELGCPWDSLTCACAAAAGHLDVLQWARAQGCPWDALTCAGAAQCGHLQVLQWARQNGCPWDEKTCSCAAGGGYNVDLFCQDSATPVKKTYAFRQERIHQWAKEHGMRFGILKTRGRNNTKGHLAVLKWARENGCPWDENTCLFAAEQGHLSVLKWAVSAGCRWDLKKCRQAAQAAFHHDVYSWIYDQTHPLLKLLVPCY